MGTLCPCCRAEVDSVHKHHIVPKVLGGLDIPTNIVECCEECHGKIHGRDMTNHKALTIEGLRKAKARGVLLGGARPEAEVRHAAVKEVADGHANRVRSVIKSYRSNGSSYRDIASHLNQLEIATARGGRWFASTVRNYDLRMTGITK